MKKFIVMLSLILGLSVMSVAAEDANGTWRATLDTPNGAVTNTFVLKVDGDKVTGSVATEGIGTQQIANGKADGDKITFSISSDYGVIAYVGTLKGDSMSLTITVGDGVFTLDATATRAKT